MGKKELLIQSLGAETALNNAFFLMQDDIQQHNATHGISISTSQYLKYRWLNLFLKTTMPC